VPKTAVVFFRDADGSIPTKLWMDDVVAKRDRRAVAKLRARIRMLESDGLDLGRPVADTLRDGIYELRAEFGGVNYRLLYFFTGSTAAVVSHGLTKEARVPEQEIDLAVRRKTLFESDPERYAYHGEI
jgi:hypothetical protein